MLRQLLSVILTTLLYLAFASASPARLHVPTPSNFVFRLHITKPGSTGSPPPRHSRLTTLQRVGNYTTGPTAAFPSAIVTVCTRPEFTGSCDTVEWPMDECIDLNDYAGKTLSFRPAAGAECYLMQGRCNADLPYADLLHDSTLDSDLSGLAWVNKTQSYICMKPIVIR